MPESYTIALRCAMQFIDLCFANETYYPSRPILIIVFAKIKNRSAVVNKPHKSKSKKLNIASRGCFPVLNVECNSNLQKPSGIFSFIHNLISWISF